MAEILVKCPSCSSKMAVKGSLVDVKLECPVCKKKFVIPAEVVAQATAQNAPESAAPAAEKSAPVTEEKTAQNDSEKTATVAEEKPASEKKPAGGIKINLKFPAKKPPQPPQSAADASANATPPPPPTGAPMAVPPAGAPVAAAPMAVLPAGAPVAAPVAAAPMAVLPAGAPVAAPVAAAPMAVLPATGQGEKLKLQLPTVTPSPAATSKMGPRRFRFTKEYVPKKDATYWIKFSFKVGIPVILLGIGIFFLVKFLIPSPESLKGNQLLAMTRKRQNRDGAIGISDIAKVDFFPTVSTKKDFFYRDAQFEEIIVGEKETEVFEGVVLFRRNGKKMQRPVIVDRRYSFSKYIFPIDYAKNPEYLEEDGDLIFALAKQIKYTLRDWNYDSGKAKEGGILECTISKGGNQKTITLKVVSVKGDDNIFRIWIEFP